MSMRATLHQLEVFEAVARHSSFTKAAEELDIAQPTASSQVKQLSKAIGLPLFEHVGKRLYLTEAGEALLSACRDIFGTLDRFEMQVAALKGTQKGRLQVCMVTTAKYIVPRLLGSFCKESPDVEVSLQVVGHVELVERMRANRDDLYVLSQLPDDLNLQAHPFLDNPLVVVAARNHPLVDRGPISLKELNAEPLIAREAESATRQAVDALFERYQLAPNIRMELSSNEAIKESVAGGLGVAVLSERALQSGDAEDLAILDVEQFPIQRCWYAAYPAGKQLSVVAKAFLAFLLERGMAKGDRGSASTSPTTRWMEPLVR